MSVRVFDFRCVNGQVSEQFVEAETILAQCPTCLQSAARMVPAPRAKLEPFTGAFPGAADKWVRDRESKRGQEKRNVENHGTYKERIAQRRPFRGQPVASINCPFVRKAKQCQAQP